MLPNYFSFKEIVIILQYYYYDKTNYRNLLKKNEIIISLYTMKRKFTILFVNLFVVSCFFPRE